MIINIKKEHQHSWFNALACRARNRRFESVMFRIMKEYVYRDLDCLIDSKTGLPIRIYVPKDKVEDYNEISKRAYESGNRLREVLKESGVV